MVYLIQADLFNKRVPVRTARRLPINLRVVFGRRNNARGLTRVFLSWKRWQENWYWKHRMQKDKDMELHGIDNPFDAVFCSRPIQADPESWLWFVSDEHGPGLSDEEMLQHLNQAAAWAQEHGLRVLATNGAQVVGCDMIKTDLRRHQLIMTWAHQSELSYGLEVALFSLDQAFSNKDWVLVDHPMLPAPHEAIGERKAEGGTLFYPGSGFDWGVLRFFADAGHFDRAIYCDWCYELSRHNVTQHWKESGYEIMDCVEIMPEDWGLERWQDLWHPDALVGGMVRHYPQQHLRAFALTLVRRGRVVLVLMLPTEAVGTFRFLLEHQVAIDGLVLQDYFGGYQWSYFSGDSYLYRLCVKHKAWPEYILCAQGAKIWPEYRVLSHQMLYRGQCTPMERSLFRRRLAEQSEE